jgi:hypothetical protein
LSISEIKEGIQTNWQRARDWVIVLLLCCLGGLLFWNKCRNTEILSLQNQLSSADTQKKIDLIDVQIKELLETSKLKKQEIKALQELQSKLESNRSEVGSEIKSEKQILDYWNN